MTAPMLTVSGLRVERRVGDDVATVVSEIALQVARGE